MMETEPGEVECANEALDRSHRIVRPDIILDPRWKETGLLTALAGLECAIRHRPNRTSILENAEFLPSLYLQISPHLRKHVTKHFRREHPRVGVVTRAMIADVKLQGASLVHSRVRERRRDAEQAKLIQRRFMRHPAHTHDRDKIRQRTQHRS